MFLSLCWAQTRSQSFSSLSGFRSSLRVHSNLPSSSRRSRRKCPWKKRIWPWSFSKNVSQAFAIRRSSWKISLWSPRPSACRISLASASRTTRTNERKSRWKICSNIGQVRDVLDIVLHCFIQRAIIAALKAPDRRRFSLILWWPWPLPMRFSSLPRPPWTQQSIWNDIDILFRSAILSMSPRICCFTFPSSLFRWAENRCWPSEHRLTDWLSTLFIRLCAHLRSIWIPRWNWTGPSSVFDRVLSTEVFGPSKVKSDKRILL